MGAAVGLEVAQVAVVAGGKPLDHLPELLRLGRHHFLHHVGGDDVAVEEVRIDVERPAQRAVVDDLRGPAEVAGALAAVGDEGIGEGAEVVLRLRVAIAETRPAPGGGLDVRHAHGGAADLRAVGGQFAVAVTAATGGEAGDETKGKRPQAATERSAHGCMSPCGPSWQPEWPGPPEHRKNCRRALVRSGYATPAGNASAGLRAAPGRVRAVVHEHVHAARVRQEGRCQAEAALEGAAHVRAIGESTRERDAGERHARGHHLHGAADLGPQQVALDRQAGLFMEEVREPAGRQAGHGRQVAQRNRHAMASGIAHPLQHALHARIQARPVAATGALHGTAAGRVQHAAAEAAQGRAVQLAMQCALEVLAQRAEAGRIQRQDAPAVQARGQPAERSGRRIDVQRKQAAAIGIELAGNMRRHQGRGAAQHRAIECDEDEGAAGGGCQQGGGSAGGEAGLDRLRDVEEAVIPEMQLVGGGHAVCGADPDRRQARALRFSRHGPLAVDPQ